MNFHIDPKIFETYPDLVIGAVVASGITIAEENSELSQQLRQCADRIRAEFDTETLSQQPKIQSWRQAYSSFGAKPKKYKSSVEGLYRMAIKGVEFKPINTIVDLYNLTSLDSMVPMGGDDLDRVEGDIVLTYARGDEEFFPLNSTEIEHPKEGEVVYRDNNSVLCRRWNWRESDKTKMTTHTRNVLIVAEGLPPVSSAEMETVAQNIKTRIHHFCGGRCFTQILDRERTQIPI